MGPFYIKIDKVGIMRTFFFFLVIVAICIATCVTTAGCGLTNNQNTIRRMLVQSAADHHECPIDNIRVLRAGRRPNTYYVRICSEVHLYERRDDGSFIDITDTME